MTPMSDDPATEPATDEAPRRQSLPPPDEHDPLMIESAEGLAIFADHVATCPLVAIDTEANSMFAYRETTCIMQVTAGDQSAIIDVIAVQDLSAMREAVDRDDVEVVFHGGDYDITVLTRDHDFRFERVFDTMIAATLLGDEKVGLAALVEDHFGHVLDKKYQRADWAKRPLTDPQIDYLRRDTMYLPSLREHYGERLREAEIEEEADIEFRRLAARRGKVQAFDPDSWRRVKGAKKLDETGRAILRELFLWREARAEKRDVPPFKVLSPHVMVAMATEIKRPPRGPHDLRGVGDGLRRRFGRDFVKLVRRGFEAVDRGDAPEKDIRPKLSPEEVKAGRELRKREDAFKDWRRKEAGKRDVPNVVVLPNPGLQWLIHEQPDSLAALTDCPDLGPKRIARYGEAWLALLNR